MQFVGMEAILYLFSFQMNVYSICRYYHGLLFWVILLHGYTTSLHICMRTYSLNTYYGKRKNIIKAAVLADGRLKKTNY